MVQSAAGSASTAAITDTSNCGAVRGVVVVVAEDVVIEDVVVVGEDEVDVEVVVVVGAGGPATAGAAQGVLAKMTTQIGTKMAARTLCARTLTTRPPRY